MTKYFTLAFWKNTNDSIHCIASITDHSVVGKRMADGIYEGGCDLYESCWVKVTPLGHHLWGGAMPAMVHFDETSNGNRVYGIMKGILATLGILDTEKICEELGDILAKLEEGKSYEREFPLGTTGT